MNKKEQEPKFNPYSEISHPDKEGVYEIDTAGNKEFKTAKRTDKESLGLEKLRYKDQERYKKVWGEAREKAGERMEKEEKGLLAKEHGERFNQLQKEEAEKLAQKELEYLKKLDK